MDHCLNEAASLGIKPLLSVPRCSAAKCRSHTLAISRCRCPGSEHGQYTRDAPLLKLAVIGHLRAGFDVERHWHVLDAFISTNGKRTNQWEMESHTVPQITNSVHLVSVGAQDQNLG